MDNIFAHVLTLSNQQKAYPKLKGCLHYLIGLLKYKIIDRRDVRGQYPLYYILLQYPDLEVYAAELIYLTTTYDNIKPWFVQKIQTRYQDKGQPGKRTHLLALLQLFKRLKLNIVTLTDLPDDTNEIRSFLNMNKLLKKTLEAVAVRNNIVVKREIAFPDSGIDQIVLQSEAYKRYGRAYQQFYSLGEFLETYVRSSYDMYETCFDSLLGNKFNFVLLGILCPEKKEQTKHYVQHIWDCIENDDLDEDNVKAFLRNLSQIHLIFDQTVFDIRENLYNFLQSNDFFKYRREVSLNML